VGDLLLYQGPNVAHWREYLLGDHSYHIFIHFLNVNGNVVKMPHVREILQDHLYKQQEIDPNFNPCRFDGRKSRYHPIDDKSPERQAFAEFTETVWENEELWMQMNKSDYVNDFRNFVQIKDGKEVPCNTFEYKYKETEEYSKKLPSWIVG